MQDNLSFYELSAGVLEQLKSQGYQESTLTVYRRTFNRIRHHMKSIGAASYNKQVGESFLSSTGVCESTLKSYRCAVRRLNDFIDGLPYACHVSGDNYHVPDLFRDDLKRFIASCKDSGNKPSTIKAKKHACILFLRFLEINGCKDLTELNAEIVSKGLRIYKNKGNYAIVRQFLKYLSDESITRIDLSGIVPRYKRQKPLPTVYTPDEVIQIESSIDLSSDTGIRNLAIVRLASRMGYRSSDIANLKWSEINFDAGYISIHQMKTGIPLSLKMPQDVIDALKAHARIQASDDNEYVFHQMRAPYERISTSIVRHAVNSAIVTSGVNYMGKKHGPHALRSSLASSMVNDGSTYETVRRILGHTDPDAIKHYAKADIENLRKCSIAPPNPNGRFKSFLDGKGAF